MTLDLILPIASTLTALAADGGRPTLLPALTVLALAVSAVLAVRLRRLQATLAETQAQHALAVRSREHQRSQREQDRGNVKQQLQATERELRAQKKKNYEQSLRLGEATLAAKQAQAEEQHALGEAQRLRRDLEARAEMARPPSSRSPARAQAPAPVPPEAVVVAPALATAAPEMVAPAADSAVHPIDVTDLPAVMGDLQAPGQSPQHEALRLELEALSAKEAERNDSLKRAALELKEARRQLGHKSKRIEDLRRVDLMSRGKIEVLEDKLRRMGREYYEAVSALARARGEVGPVPGPKPARTQPSNKPSSEAHGSPEAHQRAVPSRAAVTKLS